jgi:hypothetical protein
MLAGPETTTTGSRTTSDERFVLLMQQVHVTQFMSHTPPDGQQSLSLVSWQTPSCRTRIVPT